MKIQVWTLASDDDNGTQASVFATEAEAYAAHFDMVFTDEEDVAYAKAKAALEAEDWDVYLDIAQEYLDGSLDTYSISEQELEIPSARRGDQLHADREKLVLQAARDNWVEGSNDGLEIDDGAEFSIGDGGVWVEAWVWVADEDTE